MAANQLCNDFISHMKIITDYVEAKGIDNWYQQSLNTLDNVNNPIITLAQVDNIWNQCFWIKLKDIQSINNAINNYLAWYRKYGSLMWIVKILTQVDMIKIQCSDMNK